MKVKLFFQVAELRSNFNTNNFVFGLRVVNIVSLELESVSKEKSGNFAFIFRVIRILHYTETEGTKIKNHKRKYVHWH